MNRRKSITLAILVVLLLTFAVSGTIAYITTKTDPVKNVFTPATVDTEIEEEFNDNNVKTSVVIKNTTTEAEGGIPVYVRVAIVGNWVLDGKIVDSETVTFIPGTDWELINGYYYYKKAVSAGGQTSDLLGSDITSTTREDGAHLEVTVIHQSIQTEPAQALTDANWGWTPSSN